MTTLWEWVWVGGSVSTAMCGRFRAHPTLESLASRKVTPGRPVSEINIETIKTYPDPPRGSFQQCPKVKKNAFTRDHIRVRGPLEVVLVTLPDLEDQCTLNLNTNNSSSNSIRIRTVTQPRNGWRNVWLKDLHKISPESWTLWNRIWCHQTMSSWWQRMILKSLKFKKRQHEVHNRVFSKVFTVITVISQINTGTTENSCELKLV